MIYVERPTASEHVPPVLTSPEAEKARRLAEEFFKRSLDYRAVGTRAQERHEFDARIWLQTRSELVELFAGKCAYCESPGATNVDHFRPRTHAADLDGDSDPDHYYWLAYEWQNLYLSCQVCSQNKRNFFPYAGDLFPMAGGDRAHPGSRGDGLLMERALLLDPCLPRDEPAKRLLFDADGHVHAQAAKEDRARYGDVVRGQVTIDLLGLNRAQLVEARRREAASFRELWEDLRYAVRHQESERIEEVSGFLTDGRNADQPYAGMKRQLLWQWLTEAGSTKEWAPLVVAQLKERFRDSRLGRFAMRYLGKARKRKAPPRPRDRRTPAGNIASVEIRNFRSIRKLELDLRPAQQVDDGQAADRGPWKVMLGENGTGKSSVLQAVALALIGQAEARRLLRRVRTEPKRLRRRWLDPAGRVRYASRATVRLEMTTGESIEWVADKDAIRFLSGAQGVNTLVRGYGATRLLPESLPAYDPDKPLPAFGLRQVDNLFRPHVPLCDANAWMSSHRGDAFSPVGLAIKDLLDIDPQTGSVRPIRHRIEVEMEGTRVRLEELSAGYQSVLALGVDIMAGIRQDLLDMQQATGIVLVDEIGAHLHPRWRMAIVDRLRKAFKGLQFLVTTHEPLCLRGLMPGEIMVIRRDADHEIRALTDLPDVRHLRVDQLLTSKLFGLLTAMDEHLEADFETYYRLLGRRELTPEEASELEELRRKLDGKELLGSTRRERLFYRVVDEMLAEEAENGRPSAEAEPSAEPLESEVRERLLKIWDEV